MTTYTIREEALMLRWLKDYRHRWYESGVRAMVDGQSKGALSRMCKLTKYTEWLHDIEDDEAIVLYLDDAPDVICQINCRLSTHDLGVLGRVRLLAGIMTPMSDVLGAVRVLMHRFGEPWMVVVGGMGSDREHDHWHGITVAWRE